MSDPELLGACIGDALALRESIADIVGKYEATPGYAAKERARQQKAEREELEWGEHMIATALRGGFGKACKEAAEEITQDGRRKDSYTVREVQRALIRLRATDHAVSSLRTSR